MNDVTHILEAVNRGEADATDLLLDAVYGELRQLAAAKLAHERPGNTLQATALVNEAYMRLFGERLAKNDDSELSESNNETESSLSATTLPADVKVPQADSPSEEMASDESASRWHSRRHFFAAAAEAMRRILIDRARSRQAIKRGGDRAKVDLDLVDCEVESPSTDILALDEALEKLQMQDPRKADVVKLRYFAGLTIEQTAQALNVSEPTVKRHWFYARAWLRREVEGDDMNVE